MTLLENKKVRSEYDIEQTLVAGIVLSGPEVKSLRNKSGSLTDSYIKIIDSEAFLLNTQITPYAYADNEDYDPKRTRKLLLKRKEILKLIEVQEQKKKALIPLKITLIGKKIKVEIGVGRGLKQFEKREKIKKRDQQREIEREIKKYT